MNFRDAGYFRKSYSQPGWKDNTEEDEINDVIHPFAIDGSLLMKHFNCMQKAITYCILRNGGSCPEEYLVRFIQDHWTYVNSDRSHPFTIPPGLRLLHTNTQAKKHELLLFIRDRHERENFMCNTPDEFRVSQVLTSLGKPRAASTHPELTKTSHVKRSVSDAVKKPETAGGRHRKSDEQSKEESGKEDLPPKEGQSKQPPHQVFQQFVLKAVSEANGITIDELTTLLADKLHEPGPFSELPGPRRIRAILIVLKAHKKVVEINGQWRITQLKSEPRVAEHQQVNVPAQIAVPIKEMTLSDFYLYVKSKADRPI
jgi:hypothetical protein